MNKKERIGTIETKILNFLETKNKELQLIDIIKEFELHKSEAKRILFALERKNKIRFIDDTILLIQTYNNLNFSKRKNIFIFFESLKFERYFQATNEYINIQTNFVYFELLRSRILYNKSLQEIKKKNEATFKKLVNSAFEQINYDLINLAKRISTWSNGKYEIEIVEEIRKFRNVKYKIPILKLIYAKRKNIVTFYNNNNNMQEKKVLCECIDLIIKTLKRIQNNINYLSHFDYSNH
jgi:hypothetical protein